MFLFFFWENVLFNSHVPCYVTCSCRKAFKQPFTDVLQKKRLEGRCFSVNIATFLRAAFLLNTCSFYLFKFRVIFYYCKIRPRKHKNFATDRPKLVFRYLNISLLQRFVSSSNWKEKLVALNWTILVSNFSKYIVQKQSPGRVLLKRCS